MRLLSFLVLLLVSFSSAASNPPASGTFSNVESEDTAGYKTSLKNKINLIVTVNKNGQQFFIQCFTGNKAGFGVVTTLKKPRLIAKIRAASDCPAREVQVELNYDSAAIRMDSGWVYLPRGNIHVPMEP